MNKTELEYAKIQTDAQKHAQGIGLIKYMIQCSTYLVALWIIFSGLDKILAGQNSDGISAIAKVVEALHLGSILGYVAAAGAAVAWKVERTGKKRAIKEKDRYQKIAEKDQSNRTSSGLNKDGSTPKDDDDE